MTEPTKGNFTQPLSIKEIQDEFEGSKDNYYRAFPISNNEDLELYLKREPNSYLFNIFFDVGLKARHVNMDIKPLFNEYKIVTYMC